MRIGRVLAALAGIALLGASPPPLPHWAPTARAELEHVIAAAPPGAYAVFDADNTIWKNDLEEALLPWLEAKGVLSPARLDPALRLIPFKPGESLYGYYLRLCAIDDEVCYPWIAQVFAGRSLRALKRDVDAMMSSGAPIPVRFEEGGRVIAGTVSPPEIYPGQRELIAALRAKGIRVFVVTAASEELARMVLSDPKYGLAIPPADVIGVSMLLRDPATGAVTTARRQVKLGHFLDAAYPPSHHMAMTLTPALWAPMTWYEGKVAAIKSYIDPVKRPYLVAGDSRSDLPMLFYSDGARVWVNHNAKAATELAGLRSSRDGAAGWIVTDPATLGR